MGKTRNIKYQFKYCIDTHFREGMDKHSMKRNGKDNSKIYSYADRKNLIDLDSNRIYPRETDKQQDRQSRSRTHSTASHN